MWRGTRPVESAVLREFEMHFKFRIHPAFREYLSIHNAGFPSPGTFPTIVRERKMESFLDFTDRYTSGGAWKVNERLREKIGPKRIIVGTDSSANFICIERDYQEQYIVVWSHVTGKFERCLLDIPGFIRLIG